MEVTGGVDTHADVQVAAAIDHNGGLLGVESFPAEQTGYEELLAGLIGSGPVVRVGVEGTGSWGVGLARFLGDHDVMVVEVDRPNRQKRRKQGKSDPTDARTPEARPVMPCCEVRRQRRAGTQRSRQHPPTRQSNRLCSETLVYKPPPQPTGQYRPQRATVLAQLSAGTTGVRSTHDRWCRCTGRGLLFKSRIPPCAICWQCSTWVGQPSGNQRIIGSARLMAPGSQRRSQQTVAPRRRPSSCQSRATGPRVATAPLPLQPAP